MENEALRLLLIHADKFEYETKERAVKEPEPLSDHGRKGGLRDGLVVFSTVEKSDEESPENTVINAAESIEEVLGWLKTKRVMIYPYAHLSTNLASRDPAIKILKSLEQKLAENGYEVSRSPFGWYKGFTITAKDHPLSELSRTITSKQQRQAAAPIKSEYAIMDEAGELHTAESFNYKPGMEEFHSLVEKEALKKGLIGGQPRFLDYARRFGIEWESYADVGHMRFGPEADMMIQLLSDYANTVTRRIGIPILNVRGTNMFDVNVQPIKEHLQLFGSRAYELGVDERSFVLRYAACFQQFSMVKDWTLSYRNLPFGTLEVADSYRMEQSGELLLSFRLRKFLMPDLHVYLTDLEQSIDVGKRVHERIYEEVRKLNREYVSLYNTTRSFFKEHKDLFLDLVKVEKKPILINFVPEGIYYWVLNVEYNIIDDLDRPREIATFQIDIGNAKRFDIHYANEKGERVYPVIIHTAVLGGLERYLFTLMDTAVRMEKQGKKPMLPVWVSPVHARIIPISKHLVPEGAKLLESLEKEGLRVDLDERDDTLQSRIREAELSWVPYIIVLGEKEIKTGELSVRARAEGKEIKAMFNDLVARIKSDIDGYPSRPLTYPKLLSQRPGFKRI
ncbi:MAG TPA: threonine--tRNA ligase [Candidatus Dormibacteraeota bacterium]|nr:threonine--tRNA ligase [Candidatus Dormibacteraeota bacterium]